MRLWVWALTTCLWHDAKLTFLLGQVYVYLLLLLRVLQLDRTQTLNVCEDALILTLSKRLAKKFDLYY